MNYELFSKGELISVITSQNKFAPNDQVEKAKRFIQIMDEVNLFLSSNKKYLHRF